MNRKLARVEQVMMLEMREQSARIRRGRHMWGVLVGVTPIVGLFFTVVGFLSSMEALSHLCGHVVPGIRQAMITSYAGLFVAGVLTAGLWVWDYLADDLEREMQTASNDLMICLMAVERKRQPDRR